MQQEFAIAFGAGDGGIDNVDRGSGVFFDAGVDAIDGALVSGRIADDASFADVLASGLELRLDEEDEFESCAYRGSSSDCLQERRQDEGSGDEGDVHGEEGDVGGQIAGIEEAGIGALHEDDARIVAERLGDLAITGVDGENTLGAVLQHAVGEAAGGGANVETEAPAQIDVPVSEGSFELESATADVAQIAAEEADGGIGGDRVAGLIEFLLIDEDAAGEDEGLGALAGGGEAEVHQ